MSWMNRFDVDDACEIVARETEHGNEFPNLVRAVETLSNLVRWTDENSDGWPYWPKPSRAAKTLQEVVQSRTAARGCILLEDISDTDLTRALRPVKAFLTRQGVDHALVIR